METVVVSAYWDVSVVGGSIFRVGLIGHVSVIEGATGDTSTGQIRGDPDETNQEGYSNYHPHSYSSLSGNL